MQPQPYMQPPMMMQQQQPMMMMQQPIMVQQPVMMQQQPVFYPQQQQQHQNGPTIINIGGNRHDNGNNNGNSGTFCTNCNRNTSNVPRKAVGCTAFLWCAFLIPTVVCWMIPFCSDGCKDTELVCSQCAKVKQTVQANCC